MQATGHQAKALDDPKQTRAVATKSYPNPQNLEFFSKKNLANRVEGLAFVLFMAVFALLEDALALGVLGNLPGALTAD